ncbi:hypothetical protein G3T14_18800 [Methylobacterium sp. BTF04]|uniref:hypothetical protein n=1 Tax=Methylobacterium sp. BTF04 TaxID=2708300 RepID=UPI0013D31859|nr:hypothetical protein [Methylobacterium sp. BTF04]NEU14162.1 hypothetical protein [Methylobacterium sp. BTF04]
MKPSLLSASLAAFAILSGAHPTLAAEPDRPAPSGMEWWRLRSTDVLTTGATSPSPVRTSPASEIPEARRAVRMVYPGLVGSR